LRDTFSFLIRPANGGTPSPKRRRKGEGKEERSGKSGERAVKSGKDGKVVMVD
jgi:hypothetical protein